MSIEEKLARIQQEQEEQEKEAPNPEVEKARTQIKEITERIRKIALIKESLSLGQEDEEQEGMRKFSTQAKEKIEQATAVLEKSLKNPDSQAVLSQMGIADIAGLLNHEAFAENEDVLAYHDAVKEWSALGDADYALQEELIKLGVEVGEEGDFYDNAATALDQKLASLEAELVQQKLKTPEGKEKIVENLAETFRKDISEITVRKDGGGLGVDFLGLGHGKKISVQPGGQVTFQHWKGSRLMPGDADEIPDTMKETYGADVVKEAIIKAYEDNLQAGFDAYDEKNGGFETDTIKEELSRISPEKREAAIKSVREFEELAQKFQAALDAKADEFNDKGLSFNTTKIDGYGGTYAEAMTLKPEGFMSGELSLSTLEKEEDIYPPKIDFAVLQKHAQKRIQQIKDFTDLIEGYQTMEDVYGAARDKVGTISKIHTASLYADRDPVRISQATTRVLDKFSTHEEALQFVSDKEQERSNLQAGIVKKIEGVMEAQEIVAKIRGGLEKNPKIGSQITDVESKQKAYEREAEKAEDMLQELTTVQVLLPVDEEVLLGAGRITLLSVKEKREALKKSYTEKAQELQDLKTKISLHKSKEPKLLGKKKWANELVAMENTQQGLEQDLSAIQADKEALPREEVFLFNNINNSRLKDEVLGSDSITGYPSAILETLRQRLREIQERKVPQDLVDLYEDYKKLSAEIDQG